jgi:hypothetical protein
MTTPEPTLAEVRYLFDGTAHGAATDFALAQSHDARVKAVQKGVDFACAELEKRSSKKQGLGEDAITLDICSMLSMAGFQASHDKYNNGHCDIVVDGKDTFVWLAEAKEHSNYAWLDKGFQQLTTRYSTGTVGQDHGDVLIYCYNADAKTMLGKWRTELLERNGQVKAEESPCGNPLVFCSTNKHIKSGLNFHVRHKALALYWDPKDK